ncbi:MAG: toll/interleukin-1 receptor domain-containing protein [Anaerolineae bacterium]|jgi:hypothetical protein|nr:toll/interleukin-1 receptor domain-containing protein [Anaerolineae bacterium]MBT7484330.1 toll/interleukin-1 receptor domain-containing protein [Candidatus Peregrinibacteria bacterium]MBT4308846.1 toll/interleukin-1 receptor domain-containing protein [Anaerolineae bacterium]MBT4457223.1 toll/interleukin-1 receptor domain-containing protein [Anaerolineae bacterium]MBT4841934.1 toll/interleukin-1 receptor domain-containing protein [Anaerolineae bacterium]
MAEGSWIFLSHSHKDFDRVSEIRNILEEKEHHPLMFFLKCLNDEDEIDDLIRREIEARSWFIFCDSVNARNSLWVQQEIEIIKGYPEKTYCEVVVDDPNVDLEQAISQLTRKASVFLTYSHHDQDFADQLKAELRNRDFGVFSALEIIQEKSLPERFGEELLNVSSLGAILPIVSVKSVQAIRQKIEVEAAAKIIQREGAVANIIQVYRDEPSQVQKKASQKMRDAFEDLNWVDFSTGSLQENVDGLVKILRDHEWSN